MAKTLIITGAGASCDWLTPTHKKLVDTSGHKVDARNRSLRVQLKDSQKHTPPLTSDLVLALQPLGANCSQLLQLIDQYAQSPGPFDFEETLRTIFVNRHKEFEAEFDALRVALKDRMAKADLIGSKYDTLYTSLYARIKGCSIDDRTTLTVNLNYDRMAELAITNHQGFRTLDEYINNDTGNLLFHPHGNCGWNIYHNTGLSDRMIMDGSATNYIYNNQNPAGGLPCLAIPMSGDYKGKTAWPQQHANKLNQSLQDVDNLVVIGWRGSDKHIVDMISTHIGTVKNIHIVSYSASGTDECASNLSSLNKGKITPVKVSGGFRNYIVSKEIDALFPLV